MKSLSKEQATRRECLLADLLIMQENVDAAVTEYNSAVQAAFQKLQGAVDVARVVVDEISGFIDEVVGDMEMLYDQKSERWQESEAGRSFEEWKNSWEQGRVEDPEVEEPTYIDEIDLGVATFVELPGEP